MRDLKNHELLAMLLACLEAKDNFRASKDVFDKETNHERLFVLLATLPIEQIIEQLSDIKGAA